MENKSKLSEYIDTVWLALGEAVVVLLVCLGFVIARLGGLDVVVYKALLGALLGGAVTVLNFHFLSVAINRAVKNYITERGEKEMDEEEAEAYAKKHGMAVQNAMVKSYIFRMVMMIGMLVLAMISGWFSPLATVIPLLMYKPVLYTEELIKSKLKKER